MFGAFRVTNPLSGGLLWYACVPDLPAMFSRATYVPSNEAALRPRLFWPAPFPTDIYIYMHT